MTLVLDRLNSSTSYFDANGRPTPQMQLFWQRTVESIEAAFNALEDTVTTIAAAQAAADAANLAAANAQAAADSADTAATNAQGAAEQAASDNALATSGVSGMTMTATDAGASATITISAHTRIYGDGTSVSVSGGSITGLLYNTGYYVFYLDPARAGGAVTYQASTNAADAAQTGSTHSLGGVTTPVAAAPPTQGNPNLPPGVQEP